MKKMGQKGFTLIEGFLLVIAITLVVGVGYYVLNASKQADNNLTSTPAANSTKTKPAKKYLEIPELGVKFELTDKLKNAYYAKVGDYYYFSVHDFENNSTLADCVVGGSNGGLGILALNPGKLGEPNKGTAAETPWTQEALDKSGYKKVGDTYYGFVGGNGPCIDVNAADADEAANTVGSFKKAFIDQESTFQKL